MSDFIVLVVTSIGISVCFSALIIGIIKGDIDADVIFIKSHIKSVWSSLRTHDDELDILRARVYDLEQKLKEITKEMEKVDDGK